MTEKAYKHKILVVDDNHTVLNLLKKILVDLYSLSIAASGKEALEILKSQDPPDLILSDIMMPEMSGYELLKEIKKDARIASIPIIFITALGSEADEIKGLEKGAVDYIVKPIKRNILLARINNILKLSQYQRESAEKLPETMSELFPEETIEAFSEDQPESNEDQSSLVMVLNTGSGNGSFESIDNELSDEFEMAQANSSSEVFQVVKNGNKPHLFIIETGHSSKEPIDTIRQLKQQKLTQSVPIMLLTAKENDEEELNAFKSGCADYLSKSMIPTILKARVRILVELNRHRRQFEQQLDEFLDE